MPKIHEMMESKFLRKEDVNGQGGIIVTIAGVRERNVALPEAETILKWTIDFEEIDKPMVLNSTNITLCAKACGSDNTDDWTGKKIVLYEEPNVSYMGKVVGGIRIRALKSQAEPKVLEKKSAQKQAEDY